MKTDYSDGYLWYLGRETEMGAPALRVSTIILYYGAGEIATKKGMRRLARGGEKESGLPQTGFIPGCGSPGTYTVIEEKKRA